jgi:hypothetical protein
LSRDEIEETGAKDEREVPFLKIIQRRTDRMPASVLVASIHDKHAPYRRFTESAKEYQPRSFY